MAQRTQGHTILPEARATLLDFIKRKGEATVAELAEQLNATREGARQHLVKLEAEGWVQRVSHSSGNPGRPHYTYRLTPVGDHLFPKNYDGLALQLIELLIDQMGEEGLKTFLTTLTDKQVARWATLLNGKSLREKIEELKGIYFAEDPFTRIEEDDRGLVLIEHNCPYYNIAMEHPRMCSVTLSTLIRLLGVRVRREARFQYGEGRCAFRILADQPIDPEGFRFEFEEKGEEEENANGQSKGASE